MRERERESRGGGGERERESARERESERERSREGGGTSAVVVMFDDMLHECGLCDTLLPHHHIRQKQAQEVIE
jgi:hypothetical protein